MAPEMLITLGVLALVDSLSIGTLLIPVFFLIAPGRVRAGRMLAYLGTIAAFYFVLGVALTAGAAALFEDVAALLESPVARVLQLALGGGLLIWSFTMGGGKKADAEVAAAVPGAGGAAPTAYAEGADARFAGTDARPGAADAPSGWAAGGPIWGPDARAHRAEVGRAAKPRAGARAADPSSGADGRPGRLARWRDRAMGEGPALTVIALALGAGLVEAATMLPYLGAVGIITASGVDPVTWVGILAAYCAVMIAPALLLLALRVVARPLVEPALRRLAGWLERNAAENTAWIVGIVGFLIARDAAVTLGWFGIS